LFLSVDPGIHSQDLVLWGDKKIKVMWTKMVGDSDKSGW